MTPALPSFRSVAELIAAARSASETDLPMAVLYAAQARRELDGIMAFVPSYQRQLGDLETELVNLGNSIKRRLP